MTLRRAATFVAVVLLAGSGLDAQRRVLPPGAAVLGQVVDARSGRGLDRVIVEIDGAGLRRQLVTDHRGRYLFTGLPDGEYQILASRSGYLNGAFGQRRAAGDSSTITLAYGQWINNVDISLWRPAVITGFVTDEAGSPIAGVTVRAYRHDHHAGHAALREVSRAVTDDRGAYRVGSLVPGAHMVGISRVNNPDADIDVSAPVEVFAPVYFPSAESVAGAVTVTAESGRDVAGIDFTMTPATATIVSGRVDPSTVPEGQMSAVRLFLARPLDPFVAESRVHRILGSAVPDPEGRFAFHMVPPGEYMIEATVNLPGEPPSVRWARHPVFVGSGNGDPITITLRPGITVSGRTRVVSTSRNVNVVPTMKLAVDFEPLFEVPGIRPFFAGTTEAGDFQTGEVLVPGRYLVKVGGIPPGWRLRAVTSGGIDVSDEGLDLSSGYIPPDLTIELTDQLTLITGTVRGVGPLTDAGSTVLLFPQGSRLAARRYHRSRTSNEGTFTFINVPAGDYFIVAVDEAQAGGWQAPDRLQLLAARATAVQLREGEAKVLELRRAGAR